MNRVELTWPQRCVFDRLWTLTKRGTVAWSGTFRLKGIPYGTMVSALMSLRRRAVIAYRLVDERDTQLGRTFEMLMGPDQVADVGAAGAGYTITDDCPTKVRETDPAALAEHAAALWVQAWAAAFPNGADYVHGVYPPGTREALEARLTKHLAEAAARPMSRQVRLSPPRMLGPTLTLTKHMTVPPVAPVPMARAS